MGSDESVEQYEMRKILHLSVSVKSSQNQQFVVENSRLQWK